MDQVIVSAISDAKVCGSKSLVELRGSITLRTEDVKTSPESLQRALCAGA
jgi:hypothetical protein